MARLVVERSTIMAHLFSKPSCSTASDAVLSALLSVFSCYVRRMRKSKEGEEVYSWVRAELVSSYPVGWGIQSWVRGGGGLKQGTGWAPCHTIISPTIQATCCLSLCPLTVGISGPSVLALDQWGDSHHAHPRCPRHGHPSDIGPASL